MKKKKPTIIRIPPPRPHPLPEVPPHSLPTPLVRLLTHASLTHLPTPAPRILALGDPRPHRPARRLVHQRRPAVRAEEAVQPDARVRQVHRPVDRDDRGDPEPRLLLVREHVRRVRRRPAPAERLAGEVPALAGQLREDVGRQDGQESVQVAGAGGEGGRGGGAVGEGREADADGLAWGASVSFSRACGCFCLLDEQHVCAVGPGGFARAGGVGVGVDDAGA